MTAIQQINPRRLIGWSLFTALFIIASHSSAEDFDLGRDFFAADNPNGAWSFGWKASLGGSYSNLTVQHTSSTFNGVLIPSWQLTSFQTPAVYCNTSSVTAHFGSTGHAEPGTVWYYPGENNLPENYGVIRFTAPSNGNYRIETSVAPVYDGAPQGDTDFHVVTNGTEVFAQFLSATQSASFTGVVALAASEVVDLAIGRGADGSAYGSGLKIAALIITTSEEPTVTNLPPPVVTNPPPPQVYGDFNLGRDFSAADNPNRVWSFGWKAHLGGSYSDLTVRHTSPAGGVLIPSWQLTSFQTPAVYCNTSSVTAHFGSTGNAEPGTVWYYPGEDGRPENYGIIRFTAPSNGNYRIETSVAPVYDGAPQGDTDFHVSTNGTEVFAQFLNPTQSVSFTGVVALAADEVVDLAVGRGIDGTAYGSGLKIAALVVATSEAPTVTNLPLPVVTNPPPPQVYGDFNLGRDFSAADNPSGVWSFGWKANLGGSYSELTIRHTSPANEVLIPSWQLTSFQTPAVFCNTSSVTAHFGSTGHAEPGTVWYYPGEDGAPENYGIIRFTAPSNANYRIETTVRPIYDGVPQGDTDFHVVVDGSEVFARSLNPTQSESFTGVVALAASQVIDLAIGRGADNSAYGSGLKIAALITATTDAPNVTNLPPPVITNSPPPQVYGDFNLGRDFSATDNPDGAWSFGWKANLGGSYSELTVRHTSIASGVLIPSWQLTSFQTPAVYCNTSSVTAHFGGTGHAEPDAVWFYPGENDRPENYGIIRFTAPSNGNYEIRIGVRPVYAGSPQGNTDFHVLKQGEMLLSRFLSPSESVGLTGIVALAASEVVDMAIGRGADFSQYGSGLKIFALISPTTNEVNLTNPPPPAVNEDFNLGRDFSAAANPNGVWSFGWQNELGGTYSNLMVKHTSGAIPSWQLTSSQTPAVFCNTGDEIVSFGNGQASPDEVWFYPGEDGRPENFGVIRFTAPSNGNYRVQANASPVYNGPPQGDTDFHVLKNGMELWGQSLSPTNTAAFADILGLASGDTIDFSIGRGLDGSAFGSGLKIAVVVGPTNTASISPPEISNGSLNFTVIANTAGVLESSTNLIDWVEVQLPILTNSVGKMWVGDPAGASGPKRFYRARPARQ